MNVFIALKGTHYVLFEAIFTVISVILCPPSLTFSIHESRERFQSTGITTRILRRVDTVIIINTFEPPRHKTNKMSVRSVASVSTILSQCTEIGKSVPLRLGSSAGAASSSLSVLFMIMIIALFVLLSQTDFKTGLPVEYRILFFLVMDI